MKTNILESLGKGLPIKKGSERILDVKKGIVADLKELAKIYVTAGGINGLTNQHVVAQKLKFSEAKLLEFSRSDHFAQFSKIAAPSTEEKEKISSASKAVKEYIIKKHNAGEFADYLYRMHYQTI